MEKWPDIDGVYLNRARDESSNGNYFSAIEILKNGLKYTASDRNPKGDPYLSFWLGNMYRDLEKYSDAEIYYRYAHERLPLPQYKEKAKNELEKISNKYKIQRKSICPNCGYMHN